MTPENKEQAKKEIIDYLTAKYPEYPEIDPRAVIAETTQLYRLLIDKELIKEADVPLDHFRHIVVDQFRNASIMEQLNSFF